MKECSFSNPPIVGSRTGTAKMRFPHLIRVVSAISLVVTGLGTLRAASDGTDSSKEVQPPVVLPEVEVSGKVVDADTGKPIEGFITQAGKFDPKDPKSVTWGFSETRTTSDRFHATIKWQEGWTARILTDGYIPQPVLDEMPPAGKARIEKVIRLKKGRNVRGRVLDHLGKPAQDVSVFGVRTTGLTLVGGKAIHSFDEKEDQTVRGTKTDAEGRFELAVGVPAERVPGASDAASASSVAVSSPALDAWPAPIPAGDAEMEIRLPVPTRVEIRYDIEGGEDEASIFLQSVMHTVDTWKHVEIVRHLPIRNQGSLELTSLPPGRYQFARSRMLRHGMIGQGHFLDRQFVDVTSDKTTTISFVREKGARLSGSVEWNEDTELTGVIMSVRKIAKPDSPEGEQMFPELLDARLLRVSTTKNRDLAQKEQNTIVGNRGLFLTERIPPGTYEVVADGYAPLTPLQQRSSGIITPQLTARATVTVPESGAVSSIKLELKGKAAE